MSIISIDIVEIHLGREFKDSDNDAGASIRRKREARNTMKTLSRMAISFGAGLLALISVAAAAHAADPGGNTQPDLSTTTPVNN